MANDNPLKYMLNENCLSRLTALDYISFIPSQIVFNNKMAGKTNYTLDEKFGLIIALQLLQTLIQISCRSVTKN